ncbi:glutamate-cysteine ligase family protein [Fibrobacter sp. UWS1]|uniref:glutamate-cysteine ligase family protein n=1 Tax=Fibrobacter sp. UWS1 TaxID=1896220 RepID=UPI000BB1373D|nr:glutamate-cysteine ligase family protein [Fibrobacter sp. UWS1]PBC67706.1 gamma-glutamyl:cysteine ligase YbdK (ATP-grasp superfamily) [Fibrobacter sp. UWS1]
MSNSPWHIFERFGLELEYMIVSRETQKVMPRADAVLGKDEKGENLSDVEHGEVGLSNELVSHVLEMKCAEPASCFSGWSECFHHEILEANKKLESIGAELLPTAAHPFMDPLTETQIWPYECNDIYEAYNRIFDCRGHGWANLQSTHLNISFHGDEEFGILHAGIRLLLPLIPAIAASSPYLDSHFTGYKDARIETYRHNQEKIPSITGKVIPEAVFTEADYNRQIFERIKKDIAPFDKEKLLNHFFLNSRGAIARFDRGAIEIRLVDIQECPAADVAIAEFEMAILKSLAKGVFASQMEQREIGTDELAKILEATVREAEDANIDNARYLRLFGVQAESIRASALLAELFEKVQSEISADSQKILRKILNRGTLASTILRKLGDSPRHEDFVTEYARLAHCLSANTLYE